MIPLDQDTPDGTLVAAALAGQREAFDLIVLRYQRPLVQVARSRLGRAELAEDAVQESFLCAFKWLHTYDPKYSFRTWLWTILLNQCSRAAQKMGRQRQVFAAAGGQSGPEAVQQFASGDASPLDDILARERADRLHQLLSELPENQADALRLRFFGGLKFDEIADTMGCSLTSAKTRVRAGLLQLAQWLTHESQIQGPKAKVNDSRLCTLDSGLWTAKTGDSP